MNIVLRVVFNNLLSLFSVCIVGIITWLYFIFTYILSVNAVADIFMFVGVLGLNFLLGLLLRTTGKRDLDFMSFMLIIVLTVVFALFSQNSTIDKILRTLHSPFYFVENFMGSLGAGSPLALNLCIALFLQIFMMYLGMHTGLNVWLKRPNK